MNTILLHPTDVLFFRDGRPMGRASSGHGAAWPLPNVISHVFHAALHRAEFAGVHPHRRGRGGEYSDHKDHRDRIFGSLVTAGPFPVRARKGEDTVWYFPRPADADDSGQAVLHPLAKASRTSSLDKPCQYSVVSGKPPDKETPKAWWTAEAWSRYLTAPSNCGSLKDGWNRSDSDFSDTEHHYGIGIDPESGSVKEGLFYSAHYLRLQKDWRLGVLATAPDKDFHHPKHGNDLVRSLLNGQGAEIIAGGQQRVCTAVMEETKRERLPLPMGMSRGFREAHGINFVKWVLLTPAIFPVIEADPAQDIQPHPGGWLPSWIFVDREPKDSEGSRHPQHGHVLLKAGDTARLRNADGKWEPREVWRERIRNFKPLGAKLVAAIIGKPVPVSGWALPNGTDRETGGAKPTHLAVPAGSVYYFECEGEAAARALAAALNWHGAARDSLTIQNRRSALFGEKGFGLGVCGTWDFHRSIPPA